jgi:hypoxanthine phosphoribosyltransferase
MEGAVTIKDRRFRPYLSEEKIAVAVRGIAEKINNELAGEFPIFLVVLNGAFMFAADLLKQVNIPCEISFVRVSSYKGMSNTGPFRELIGLNEDVNGRTVVIVEDIVDSGKTLAHLSSILKTQGARNVKVASALFKSDAYTRSEPIDYIGFSIPNDFVVGYGMDFDGQGRNLRDIHILES